MQDSSHSDKPSSNGVADDELPRNCNQSSEEIVSSQTEERSQAFYEDTASKTIDFLRARLLAERATSKAAKDSAEQNAKRLMELERMLEIETEQRKKAEAAMQEVIAKLKVGRLSSASDQVDSEQRITEKRVQVEDGCSANSTCNEVTQRVQADLNNNILQEDGYSFTSSVQSEFLVKEDASNTLNSDNAKAEVLFQNSSSIGEQGQMSNQLETVDNGVVLSSLSLQNPVGSSLSTDHDKSEQGQMPNQLETVDNGIVLSSLSLQNPVGSSLSTDQDKSLNKNNQNEEDSSYQGPVVTESLADGKVIVNSRFKLEEKFGELCSQIGNAVASLEAQDKREFLRMKLHELVDEIVGTNKNDLHKCEEGSLQTSNSCSKSSALGTYVQQNINERNSKCPNLQTEVPCEGPNIVDGLKEDKSFDSCSGVTSRCQNERAAAPCIERVACKRHGNEYGHGIFRGDICFDLCECQSQDLNDRFFLENTMNVSPTQRHISNMQVPLGNVKADIPKNMQCKSLPVLQSDVSCEEFHLKMQCLADRTTNHDRVYCNHEKAMQVRSCYHSQAAVSMEVGNPMELSRVSGSNGFMPWHHDLRSSQNTPYLMKIQSPESRVYQRMGIPLKRGESLPQRNCHNYLPIQSEDSPYNVSNSNGITRHIKTYSDHEFSPFVSMQWASRGTPLDVAELPKMPRDKVGDVLIALKHAKNQIQSSIEVTKNSRTLKS